jgi:hypothetical protein
MRLADLELAAKFGLERDLEVDSGDPAKVPSSIEDFLASSSYEV